jgi:hypothetical protein
VRVFCLVIYAVDAGGLGMGAQLQYLDTVSQIDGEVRITQTRQ